MIAKYFIALCFASLFYLGCSSCSKNSANNTGNGASDSDTDRDADTDSDSESDTNSNTDTEIDAGPVVTSDAGPWEWEDLPEGEDCGEGCEQLTFSKEVRMLEWDVWDSLIVFQDETLNTRVVDTIQKKQLLLPNFYPEYQIGPSLGSANMYPAICNKTVCYTNKIYEGNDQSAVICADLQNKIQTIILSRQEQSGVSPNPAKYIDLYENYLVSMGGCGELDSWPLCFFNVDSPNIYELIAPNDYGSNNSIWGNVAVWYSPSSLDYDINGYDFEAGMTMKITDDEATQMFPRIHDKRIVYQDLKFGTSDGMGNWNHSAVFMHDLETGNKNQITNAEWIAAYPDVYGDIVVWADYRDSSNPNDKQSLAGVQIWGYDLTTKQEFKITNIPDRAKTTPRIWGDKVFVLMYKTTPGEDAIYMFDLPEKEST